MVARRGRDLAFDGLPASAIVRRFPLRGGGQRAEAPAIEARHVSMRGIARKVALLETARNRFLVETVSGAKLLRRAQED